MGPVVVSVPESKTRCFCFLSCTEVLKFQSLVVSSKVYLNQWVTPKKFPVRFTLLDTPVLKSSSLRPRAVVLGL